MGRLLTVHLVTGQVTIDYSTMGDLLSDTLVADPFTIGDFFHKQTFSRQPLVTNHRETICLIVGHFRTRLVL